MSEISQAFSSQSTTGSLGSKPGCCAPPLLGGSPAQMWASRGPRAAGERKERWCAAEIQAHAAFSIIGQVCLLDLIRIFLFLFVYVFIWKRYGCTCYRYSEAKRLTSDYSNACVCVGIPEWQKVYKQAFFKGSYLRQGRKTIFHSRKTHEIWKSWGKLCREEAEVPAWFACTSPAPLGGLLRGKRGGGP